MLRVGIVDVLDIVNIADIADVVDIGMDIADIGMDITDIAMGIADVVDSADIVDRMLRTLRWKQVDVYKVSRGCPVTLSRDYTRKTKTMDWENKNRDRVQLEIPQTVIVLQ